MYENNLPAINLSNSTATQSKLWLWLVLGIAGYYLLKDKKSKRKQAESSMTPSDLHGLGVRYSNEEWNKHKYNQTKSRRTESLKKEKAMFKRYISKFSKGKIGKKEQESIDYWNNEINIIDEILSKREKARKGGQMTLFGDLSGNLRTCDAWFQTTDKRGKSINRCFIYKPACNTKKCKADTNVSRETISEMQGTDKVYPCYVDPESVSGLSGYTATCKSWTKNRLGHKSCKSYAPTCKLPTDECRDAPAPLPYREYTKQKRTAKDTEQETIAIAQMLADEANEDLKRNKELLRDVISAGGIAPHKSGFMSEEYSTLPAKYKRKEGVPMDELAQELNMTENEFADKIYMAEAQFRMLKEMRGGSTTVKFKSDDFFDEAVQRMSSGKGFMGLGNEEFDARMLANEKAELKRINAVKAEPWKAENWLDYYMIFILPKEKETYGSSKRVRQKDIDLRNEGRRKYQQLIKEHEQSTPVKKIEKKIAEKAGQMTLFGRLPMPKMRIYSHG